MHISTPSLLLLIVWQVSLSLFAAISYEHGTIPLSCGLRSVDVEYRISFLEKFKDSTRSAMLLGGSPADVFFSGQGDQYESLSITLVYAGYKVIEVKYPTTDNDISLLPQGFYDACFKQGFENTKKHSFELYDALVKKLDFDEYNPKHRLVAAGFSLGAFLLQLMALGGNLTFHEIALSGVLFGDVVNGCLASIEYHKRLLLAEEEEICSEPMFERGIAWSAFIDYVQQLTSSGFGCCIENSSDIFGCRAGDKNEFTEDLNIENMPYLTASNITIFEGKIACKNDADDDFAGANPAQAQYIADARTKAGKMTEVIYYKECSHDVLSCAGDQAREDMVRVLAPEIF